MVAELEEDTLNLYGPLALGAFDRNWGLQAAGAVTTICFKFIDFDEICKQIHKVRSRFPSTQVGKAAATKKSGGLGDGNGWLDSGDIFVVVVRPFEQKVFSFNVKLVHFQCFKLESL